MRKIFNSNQERSNWWNTYSQDYLDLITRDQICLCCGSAENIQRDHIVPQTLKYVTRHGVTHTEAFSNSAACKITNIEKGRIQFLCSSCNMSKGNGSSCGRHSKYLGIWNHLPSLQNMEID